ncbi:hypothetical protein [Roseovarius amoyensis]|uniref:hypothetical protein n=1 Tax=Roseovarius amoyensis TaxID=2211448 RepID=UPI000DBE8C36|nr:hypothetical protein [Roseovarius amoyensis]
MQGLKAIAEAEVPKLLSLEGLDPPPGVGEAALAPRLDEQTLAYVLAAQRAFRKLKQTLSQVAGALVLEAASDGVSEVAQEGYRLARGSMGELRDLFAAARPTPRAAHHHHHMTRAIALLEEILRTGRAAGLITRGGESPDLLPMLKTAWRELGHAGQALPGFDLVDFDQACCACHPTAQR